MKKLRKRDPAFGKVARNWGKSWVSFWEGTDKLGRRVSSVFGKLLINLLKVGSVLGPLHTISWTWLCLVPPGYTSPIPGLPEPSTGPPVLVEHNFERGLSLVAGDVYLTGWFWVDLLIFFPHLLADHCSPPATSHHYR